MDPIIAALAGVIVGSALTNISWVLWDRKMLRKSQSYREQRERRRHGHA